MAGREGPSAFPAAAAVAATTASRGRSAGEGALTSLHLGPPPPRPRTHPAPPSSHVLRACGAPAPSWLLVSTRHHGASAQAGGPGKSTCLFSKLRPPGGNSRRASERLATRSRLPKYAGAEASRRRRVAGPRGRGPTHQQPPPEV